MDLDFTYMTDLWNNVRRSVQNYVMECGMIELFTEDYNSTLDADSFRITCWTKIKNCPKMGSFFCLFYLLTNADFCDKMGGPPAYAAVRIFHYTTPRQFCQEKSCTKVKKIFSRNLVILSIVIRGQSAIIDNVRREQ